MRRTGLGRGMKAATALLLLWCFLVSGCGQRVRAEVSAVVESGYQAQGQSYVLELLPGFAPEDPAEAQAVVEADLRPALGDMGYVPAAPGTEPDVRVRVWWFSTGPHPVFHMVEWRDRGYPGFGGYRGYRGYGGYGGFAHRRRSVVVEDEYARYLVVEGILSGEQAKNAPVQLAQSVIAAVDAFTAKELLVQGAEPAPPVARYASPPPALALSEGLSPGEEAQTSPAGVDPRAAARALPAAPARLLWRVRVESRGNLSKAQRILASLAAAAAPWLGKSGVVHVLVQNDEVVAAEAVP